MDSIEINLYGNWREEYMYIRKARLVEIDTIMSIYTYARKFMIENGNGGQWGNTYPSQKLIEDDIKQGNFYVCIDDDKIVGVFYFAKEDDPTYHYIEDGKWLNNESYCVIHRIASAEGGKGVATCCLNWAFEQAANIRIDTHINNKPMKYLLNKLAFVYCGKIFVDDGSPRIAFQKIE